MFWSSLEGFGVKGIGFLSQIILARILLPSDFGLIAMIAVFIGIGDLIADSGLGQSLIRNKNSLASDFSSVFYLNILLGLLVYLSIYFIAPFGIIYLIFLLDTKVHNKLDMDLLASEIPVIAEIPQIKAGVSTIFSNPNDRSVLAESFRILTTNMKFVLPSDGLGKVIFCTSTIKGEGKTFISLNLSLAMASLNKKTLLIGADLRNPQLHSYANVNKNQMGLSNYLTDPTLGWKSSTMKVFDKHPNHEVLFSGVIPPNPAHLLANGNFEKLIEEAKLIYDYIIVDLAPTILVTDTLLVAHLADATICAVRANHTDKKLIPFSVDLSNTKRLVNMSYVINGLKENRSYGYNYNYGYNYGYGDIES